MPREKELLNTRDRQEKRRLDAADMTEAGTSDAEMAGDCGRAGCRRTDGGERWRPTAGGTGAQGRRRAKCKLTDAQVAELEGPLQEGPTARQIGPKVLDKSPPMLTGITVAARLIISR